MVCVRIVYLAYGRDKIYREDGWLRECWSTQSWATTYDYCRRLYRAQGLGITEHTVSSPAYPHPKEQLHVQFTAPVRTCSRTTLFSSLSRNTHTFIVAEDRVRNIGLNTL